MKQWLLSGVVIVLLAISAYITTVLADTYIAAVLGKLEGAGAAQWQFQFSLAPIPALLGLAAFAIAWFVGKPVSAILKVLSVVAATAPAMLFLLVRFQVY